MTEVTVAVADLARFCHRTGDIDHRFSPSPTGEQGVAGHQQLYRRRPAGYVSEYPVEHVHSDGELKLVLRGRADGYHSELGYVEEIKTCRINPGEIPEAVSRSHLAQARLYAALIAMENALEHIITRITDEGLVIELFALENSPLFEKGSNRPTAVMTDLLSLVADISSKATNPIAIGAHVRAQPVVVADNPVWDTSAQRATQTRLLLETNGLTEGRMHRVTGHADREPVVDNPLSVRNNRVEIVLLRE